MVGKVEAVSPRNPEGAVIGFDDGDETHIGNHGESGATGIRKDSLV
jgi:hypothetical protein